MQIHSLKNSGTNDITGNPFFVFVSHGNLRDSIHFKISKYEYSKKILHKLEASWIFLSIFQYVNLYACFEQIKLYFKNEEF